MSWLPSGHHYSIASLIMFKRTIPVLAFCSVALTACSDSDDPVSSASKEGQWVAPAYGVALTIEADEYRYYQYTGQTCQTFSYFDQSYDQLLADVNLASGDQVLLNSFFGAKVPAMEFERSSSLPQTCISSLVANFDEDGFEENTVRDFDIFWQNFNDHYSFFELKQVDWAAQRDTWRPEVTADTSDDELLRIFAEMIKPLADGHVDVVSADQEEEFYFEGKPTFFDLLESEYEQLPAEKNIDFEEYIYEQLGLIFEAINGSFAEGAQVKEHESEEAFWSDLPNNIGYVNIMSMDGYSESDLSVDQYEAIDLMFDDIFSDLGDVDSIIIDLRLNGGGNDGVSAHIASRFTDVRTLGWQKQARFGDTRLPMSEVFVEPTTRSSFLKPVVLLTSSMTASAAEVFTLSMQAVADAQVVGEASNGVFSDILPKTLPNGISFSMSTEFYFSADGEFYEGAGIPVDVEAAVFTLEDRQSGQDPALIAAQDLLRN